MSDRYCPFCGEMVPSTSVTCPKCYRKIPVDRPAEEKKNRGLKHDTPVGEKAPRTYNRKVALILAVIPGFLGFLGIGQIYRNPKKTGGYFLLLFGLLVFTSAMLLLTNHAFGPLVSILSTLGAFPLMLLYAFLFIGALIDVLLNSVFRFDMIRV